MIIVYHKKAEKQLLRLSEKGAERVKTAINKLKQTPPQVDIKRLQGIDTPTVETVGILASLRIA